MNARPGSKGSASAKAQGKSTSKTDSGAKSKAVVPRKSQQHAVVPARGGRAQQKDNTMLVPKGYSMRPVQAAKNYDVVSFARAMNDDFGPKVKKLFDPEREAALQALQTGIYIGWRCPEFNHDCQRVSDSSKCFCGHLLSEHSPYNSKSVRVPCAGGCRCKAFAFIPARPEEVGEFWFQRRRDFDPSTWRAKCKCKHTHEEHDIAGIHRCKKCGCGAFNSNFLCAACDKHWENHETFFENESERQEQGLPVGDEYLPFAEIPSLRNMVLTGQDDEDMSYMAKIAPPEMRPMPISGPPADNNTVVPYGRGGRSSGSGGRGGGGGGASGFRPVYD